MTGILSEQQVSNAIIYLFSIAGLALTPRSLDKLRWLFPLWFLAVNLLLFSRVWEREMWGAPLLFMLLCQLPWVLVTAYMITAARQGVATIIIREWVLWSGFHLMGVHYFFQLFTGRLSQEFLVGNGIMEVLVGSGAMIVYLFRLKQWNGSGYLLLIWNLFALMFVWKLNTDIQTYIYSPPFSTDQRLSLKYYSSFPEVWLISFWVPLSICIHVVIFYAMWLYRKKGTR